MSDTDIQYVSVIGGFRTLDETNIQAAKAAGRAIGEELAKAGFGLVVYFSNDDSLEPYVVSGYAAVAPNGTGAVIRVRYAESQRGQIVFKEESARPELFEHRLFPAHDWEAPFYRSLAEEEGVGAVVLLGGGISTFIAGQIAIARRLPILAVDQFGGSAQKIWTQIAQASTQRDYPSWGTCPAGSLISQLKSECTTAVAEREETRRRQHIFTTITSRRQQAIYACGAFLMLLATLFFGIVKNPFPSAFPFVMFLALIAAGATGALVRAIIWGPIENDPRISFLLGGIAGFVVGLAYLIPQWIGAPGVLVPKNDLISDRDKIQFASAVLVALSAGVGFDTVFNRLRKEAEETAVGPPR